MELESLQEYLAETRELVERAQADVMRLETADRKDELLASIFRAFHTIKGSANYAGVANLMHWAHSLEELLDRLRAGVLLPTAEHVEVILQGLDVIGRMVDEVAREVVPAPGPVDLAMRIRQLAGETRPLPSDATTPSAANDACPPADATLDAEPSKAAATAGLAAATGPLSTPLARAPEKENPELRGPGSDSGSSAGKARAAARNEGAEKLIRVDAARLDAVMNQVGELVLLRNRLTSALGSLSVENEIMIRIAREMDLRVSDLQNSVMSLRMQPCRRLFQQIPRLVRDVSQQLRKDVRLEIVGEDVEIDKTVVDALSGPIVHIVRNSLDHGIEPQEVRQKMNKSQEAVLRIAAVHLGDRVRIEVSDDGQGIDRRLVTRKAVEKGVISADTAANLSDQEALELIFRPGFSTKEQASELSGRGVGMDVVKQTTDKLRGRLSIDTQLGQGTRISMEFPLTLAVLPVIYLRVRHDVYALPVSAIDSLTDLEEHRVHRLAGRVTYRMDGTQTVPLVDLGAVLQNHPMRLGAESVEGVLTERGLFIVSEVLGNEDSVVKPIDFLEDGSLYQGATISGQGNVVLILDAGALSAAAERGQG